MTTTFQEDCEGLTLGVAGSPWNEIVGSPTVVNTRARSGTKSIEFNANNGVQVVSQTFADPPTVRYMRRSWWVNGRPTAGGFVTLQRIRSAANVTLGEVRLNASGQIVLRDGTLTSVATSTSIVPLSAWWAATWAINGTTQILRYYTDPTSNTAAETISGNYSGGAFGKVVSGCGNSGTNNPYLIGGDDWLDDNSTWPSVGSTTDTGLKKFALRGGVYVPLTTYSLRT